MGEYPPLPPRVSLYIHVSILQRTIINVTGQLKQKSTRAGMVVSNPAYKYPIRI